MLRTHSESHKTFKHAQLIKKNIVVTFSLQHTKSVQTNCFIMQMKCIFLSEIAGTTFNTRPVDPKLVVVGYYIIHNGNYNPASANSKIMVFWTTLLYVPSGL
jgi:uncharacterized membrane-anchored protein